MELGGIYFFVNALMTVLSWFVAAALYSLYYPTVVAEPAHDVNVSTLASMVNVSANVTDANSTGAPSASGMQLNWRSHSVLPRAPQVSTCMQARSATCRSS